MISRIFGRLSFAGLIPPARERPAMGGMKNAGLRHPEKQKARERSSGLFQWRFPKTGI